jgi:hypothetical protein
VARNQTYYIYIVILPGIVLKSFEFYARTYSLDAELIN